MSETPLESLDELKAQEDALDQSVALNHIVMTMLESKRREDLWLKIILILSILVNVVISIIFVEYEYNASQVTTTTTTVTQDTGEGSGNNVYQSGENAVYEQTTPKEVN